MKKISKADVVSANLTIVTYSDGSSKKFTKDEVSDELFNMMCDNYHCAELEDAFLLMNMRYKDED